MLGSVRKFCEVGLYLQLTSFANSESNSLKRFKKILVATDTRLENNPIIEEAVEIATHNEASLKIIDIVPPFTWMSRYVTEDHEHLSELIAREKTELLSELAEKIRSKGIDVETKVLKGKASTEITRETIRGEHDLVMAVAKGKHSNRDGFFGHTALRLLRQCPEALWLVAPDSTPKFKHILGCVDTASEKGLDKELNDKIVELCQSVSNYHDARFSIIHAWSMDDEALLSSRFSEDVIADYERDEQQHYEKKLDTFLAHFDLSCESDNIHLVKGETAETIVDFADANSVDLLVMGTVARTGLGGFFIGNMAEKILEQVTCSVLALKPYGFKSSIKVN